MDIRRFFLFLLMGVYSVNVSSHDVNTYGFLMPHIYVNKNNLYLCTYILIRDNFYIVGFDPHASTEVVHRMLLYGCSEPGSNDSVWSCDDSQDFKLHTNHSTVKKPCRNESQILYVWARNTTSLRMPEGVGFYVGRNSPIKYLVLQVQYLRHDAAKDTDNSGVFLNYTKEYMPRQAGVIYIGARGSISPKTVEQVESTCTIKEDKILHPFAFNIHTHGFGRVVSGFVVRPGASGDTWSTLGKKNPQKPQIFYPVRDKTPIRKGDILATRCTINNTLKYGLRIGKSYKDEKCDFYLMYWVEDDTPLEHTYCYSPGPPAYYWHRALENFRNIPNVQASII